MTLTERYIYNEGVDVWLQYIKKLRQMRRVARRKPEDILVDFIKQMTRQGENLHKIHQQTVVNWQSECAYAADLENQNQLLREKIREQEEELNELRASTTL